jgi:hypothetical protein
MSSFILQIVQACQIAGKLPRPYQVLIFVNNTHAEREIELILTGCLHIR